MVLEKTFLWNIFITGKSIILKIQTLDQENMIFEEG